MPALTLGTLIDRAYQQNQVVRAKQRGVAKAEAVVQKEKTKALRIENTILDRFKKDKIDGSVGKVGRAELKIIIGVNISNWGKLTKYIVKTKRFSLFQRRINKAAWLEELETRKNRPVPGLKTYQAIKLSITKK